MRFKNIFILFLVILLVYVTKSVEESYNDEVSLEKILENVQFSNSVLQREEKDNGVFVENITKIEDIRMLAEFVLCRTILLLMVLSVLCSYYYITSTRLAQLVNKFPGYPILPIIGCAYVFIGPPTNVLHTISSQVKKFGTRFRIWKLHNPYIILLNAPDVQLVLSSSVNITKGRDYKELHWMNGLGLVTTTGDVWRTDRKVLNPTFKYQKFDGFLTSFNKHGKILMKILHKTFPTGKEKINIHPTLSRCTMDTIFESVLGTTLKIQESVLGDTSGEEKKIGNELYECGYLVLESYRTRAFKPWRCLPIIKNILGITAMEERSKKCYTETMTKIIEKRRKAVAEGVEEDETVAKPFIDVLLDTRSTQNIVDHAFTMFSAGFETNSTTINFTLFCLALYPECQDKVRKELDSVFEKERDVKAKDLGELKYLEMCVNETMRHFPPVPLLVRNLEEDVVLGNGMVAPKGADATIFVHELHNDPSVFPHPEKYNPDHFLPQRIKKRHPFSFIPFSKGPRNCIGQKYAMTQIKTLLAHILKEFTVSTAMKKEDVNIIYGVLIETDVEVYLTLTPRTK